MKEGAGAGLGRPPSAAGRLRPQGDSGHLPSGMRSAPQLLSCWRLNQMLSPQLGPQCSFVLGSCRLPHLVELLLTITDTMRVPRGFDHRMWITYSESHDSPLSG